jgi:aldose 1-epimerase
MNHKSHSITETGPDLIPSGRYLDLKGGPLDFSSFRRLGPATDGFQCTYDCIYVLNDPPPDQEKRVAVLKEWPSGRIMTLHTNTPGLQFFTGHKIPEKTVGKQGVCYGPLAGLCLEPRQFPIAVNIPGFPSVILRPGHIYRNAIRYVFSIEG